MDIAQATESNLVHGMFLVVQSLQLIYYIFEVYLAWANPHTAEYKLVTQFADILRYLHISGFVKESATSTPFYILFFAIMTIKSIVYSFIAQNVLRDDEKKTSDTPNVADMILRLLYIFNFYMFFIPVTDGLSTCLKCYGASRIFTNRTYAYCQIEASVVYLCVSVVVLIIKIVINVSHELCDTEKRIKFSKRWSKKDNLVFIMRTFCILATIVLFNLELFSPPLTAGIFFVLNALTYAVKFAYPTFYSKPASKFFLLNSFVVFWMSAWLFLTITAGKLFHQSLVPFLFGLCLILLLFLFKPVDDDLKVVLTPFEDIDSSRALIDKLEGMLYWISVSHLSDVNKSTLEKIIAVEQEDFTLEEQFNLFVAIKARNIAKFTKLENQSLLNHIHMMYQQGMMKFNNSPDLQLSFACFLAESDNKENLALEKLISLEASTSNTNTLYVIQTLKDHILTQQRKHDAADDSWGSLVFEQIMNKRLEEKLNSLLLKATQAVCDLYTLLEDEGTLIQKAKEQVLRVHKSKAKLEAFWRENSRVFSVSAELVERLGQAFRSIYDQDHICGTSFGSLLAKRRDEKAVIHLNGL